MDSIDETCNAGEIIELKPTRKKIIIDLFNREHNEDVGYDTPVYMMHEHCPICPYAFSVGSEHYCIKPEI